MIKQPLPFAPLDKTAIGLDKMAIGVDATPVGLDEMAIGLDKTAIGLASALHDMALALIRPLVLTGNGLARLLINSFCEII